MNDGETERSSGTSFLSRKPCFSHESSNFSSGFGSTGMTSDPIRKRHVSDRCTTSLGTMEEKNSYRMDGHENKEIELNQSLDLEP